MNTDGKLGQAILGAIVSWGAVVFGWIERYSSIVATGIAITAGVYSIWASVETIKTRRLQRKQRMPEDDSL